MKRVSARAAVVHVLLAGSAALTACAGSATGPTSTPPGAGSDSFCPTIPAGTKNGFLIHGARLLDGVDRERPPSDVLVAGGEVVAVGPAICFRAVGGSIAFIEGRGATLLPLRNLPRIEPGMPADLVLVEGDGATGPAGNVVVRAMWKRGERESAEAPPTR